jgi:hypothetical protein
MASLVRVYAKLSEFPDVSETTVKTMEYPPLEDHCQDTPSNFYSDAVGNQLPESSEHILRRIGTNGENIEVDAATRTSRTKGFPPSGLGNIG